MVKYAEKHKQLTEMGFEDKTVSDALDTAKGDIDAAMAVLLGESSAAAQCGSKEGEAETIKVTRKATSTQKEKPKVNMKEMHDKFMATYKVQKCKEKAPHDKRMCIYYHSKNDRRRNPFEVPYMCVECPNQTDTVDCKDGDACLKAHNMLERMFHPELYKISMCQRGPNGSHCERGNLCAFAHSEEDHRMPSSTMKGASATPAQAVESIQPAKALSDSRLLDKVQENLVRLIRNQGNDGIISSELPKRYYDEFGVRLELTDEAGEKFRIKDILLQHTCISVQMHKNVQPKYIYNESKQTTAAAPLLPPPKPVDKKPPPSSTVFGGVAWAAIAAGGAKMESSANSASTNSPGSGSGFGSDAASTKRNRGPNDTESVSSSESARGSNGAMKSAFGSPNSASQASQDAVNEPLQFTTSVNAQGLTVDPTAANAWYTAAGGLGSVFQSGTTSTAGSTNPSTNPSPSTMRRRGPDGAAVGAPPGLGGSVATGATATVDASLGLVPPVNGGAPGLSINSTQTDTNGVIGGHADSNGRVDSAGSPGFTAVPEVSAAHSSAEGITALAVDMPTAKLMIEKLVNTVKQLETTLHVKSAECDRCKMQVQEIFNNLKISEQNQLVMKSEKETAMNQSRQAVFEINMLRETLANTEMEVRRMNETMQAKDIQLSETETSRSLVNEIQNLRAKMSSMESEIEAARARNMHSSTSSQKLHTENESLRRELHALRMQGMSLSNNGVNSSPHGTQRAHGAHGVHGSGAAGGDDALRKQLMQNQHAQHAQHALAQGSRDRDMLLQYSTGLGSQIGGQMNMQQMHTQGRVTSGMVFGRTPGDAASNGSSDFGSIHMAQQGKRNIGRLGEQMKLCCLPSCQLEGIYTCSRCNSVGYCSEEHQR